MSGSHASQPIAVCSCGALGSPAHLHCQHIPDIPWRLPQALPLADGLHSRALYCRDAAEGARAALEADKASWAAAEQRLEAALAAAQEAAGAAAAQVATMQAEQAHLREVLEAGQERVAGLMAQVRLEGVHTSVHMGTGGCWLLYAP